MTTEGWPDDDRVTGAADSPSVVRHCAGPVGDEDRYEILGRADGSDEGWHVLDRRAHGGDALLTLVTLRPPGAGADDADEHCAAQEVWRQRAAGLVRVRHARLAGVLSTFTGPGPHVPGRARGDEEPWSYAVLEQASGRSVADWLRDDPGAAVQERLTVLAAGAGVLQELHRGSEQAPPLVHGDITPRTVRLGGFWPGDGVRLAGASLGGVRRGPLHAALASPYTAPEVRAGALPSAASDVFGFGATAIAVLTGQTPAVGEEGDLDLALVRRQLGAAPQTAPHPRVADLLLQAVAHDPHERPDRLPAWVNGLRAQLVAAGSVQAPSGADGARAAHADDVDGRTAAPVRTSPTVRTLPRRPVGVVVGALVLATAGAGIAIAAVQQGRLKDVPNPVAIVQPQPVDEPTAASLGVPEAPASSAAPPSAADESSAASPRRSTSSAPSGALPSSPSALPPPSAPAPGLPPRPGFPPVPVAPLPGPVGASETPTVPPLLPPVVSDPVPSSPAPPRPSPPVVVPPPVTSPPVVTPPVVTPPVVTPPVVTPPVETPTTPPTTSPDPSPTEPPASPTLTSTPVPTPSTPPVDDPAPTSSGTLPPLP